MFFRFYDQLMMMKRMKIHWLRMKVNMQVTTMMMIRKILMVVGEMLEQRDSPSLNVNKEFHFWGKLPLISDLMYTGNLCTVYCFQIYNLGTKVSNGTKTMSIIEVLCIKAEGQVAAKNRQMDLYEREIALAECKMLLEECKYEDNRVLQPQQFQQVSNWNIN